VEIEAEIFPPKSAVAAVDLGRESGAACGERAEEPLGEEGDGQVTGAPPASDFPPPFSLTDAVKYPGDGSAGELLVLADGEEAADVGADLALPLPQLRRKRRGGEVASLLFLTPKTSKLTRSLLLKADFLTSASPRSSSSSSSSSQPRSAGSFWK